MTPDHLRDHDAERPGDVKAQAHAVQRAGRHVRYEQPGAAPRSPCTKRLQA